MPPSGTLELRTIGHACLLVLEDGKPIIATDPWLVGSVYWRSWWLEKYPSEEEIDLVRQSRYLYLTHSHLDHFHWPSLRRLGPLRVLHPAFPSYSVPGFLESHGFRNRTLAPLTWYALSDKVRVCSVPVPFDEFDHDFGHAGRRHLQYQRRRAAPRAAGADQADLQSDAEKPRSR